MAHVQENGWTLDHQRNNWYRDETRSNGQIYRVYYANSQSSASSASATISTSTSTTSRNTVGYGYTAPVTNPQYAGPSTYQSGSAPSHSDNMNINYAQTVFKETSGEFEKLDPSYRKIDPKEQWEFWKPGRVFKALWWESQGDGGARSGPSEVRYGEQAFAKVYRFIVIKAKPGESWSTCLRISTHGGQATTKKGLDQKQHTIVYTDAKAPEKLPGEKKMNKDPIRVVLVDDSEKLDPLSRVNLAKSYPVEHNVKVKPVGHVTPAHLKKLQAYWKDCFD